MNSPGPTPTDIQSHLYNSFIHASTYDVAIRVSGTWKAIYKLHRVVLIQSGFFRSLFMAGFSESKSIRLGNGKDEISVVFDDCNITRPAFEICISRLYGGGPTLHVSPDIIPTTEHPLTPPFSGVSQSEGVPPGHQPSSHRLLLSILATAIYLSIPSVASQALSLILRTVGPTTIMDYLNFACGKSLAYLYPQEADSRPAVGLENIAVMLDCDPVHSATHRQFTKSIETLPSVHYKMEPFSLVYPEGVSADSEDGSNLESSRNELSCHYGNVSDKIGEACASWLNRWATDMLQLEIEGPNNIHSALTSLGFPEGTTSLTKPSPPVIWGRGGLSAKWIFSLVSADTLFVKNERERYNFARTIVELRRRDGILEEEEVIWKDMFEHGIHYTHMSFEDLHFISQDISPTTKQLFVPLHILQAAHWRQSVLRQCITNRPLGNAAPGTPSPPKDKDLGITLTTAEILTKLAEAPRNEFKERYFPVFTDQSIRIGDGGNNSSLSSMEDLFSPAHHLSPKLARTSMGQEHIPIGNVITTEEKFFGILTPQLMGQDCVNADNSGKARWSPHPPYRFSVEFWDVDLLKEKSRLHSQTIWYGGNLFNVYVQLVRKKGQVQLGIYLHRQSHVDPIPAPSVAPSRVILPDFQPQVHQSSTPGLTLPHNSYSSHISSSSLYSVTRSGTPARNGSPSSQPSPSSSPQNASTNGSTQATNLGQPLYHPYRDPRSSITAYFAISCASATGSSQTRFSSSPDTFSVSQSWGWKSSSLRTEEYLEVGSQTLPRDVVRGREASLRATVVLGLV